MPVFLPGESQGQRRLAGYGPQGHKESDTTEATEHADINIVVWASLVGQMVKNLPAMRETWVRSLDWEDSLKEGMATHSSILAWRIPMDREAWWAVAHGVTESREWDTTE